MSEFVKSNSLGGVAEGYTNLMLLIVDERARLRKK